MPPEWMWPIDHEIEAWFERVDRERDEKYGTGRDKDDRDEVPMMGNELADKMRG